MQQIVSVLTEIEMGDNDQAEILMSVNGMLHGQSIDMEVAEATRLVLVPAPRPKKTRKKNFPISTQYGRNSSENDFVNIIAAGADQKAAPKKRSRQAAQQYAAMHQTDEMLLISLYFPGGQLIVWEIESSMMPRKVRRVPGSSVFSKAMEALNNPHIKSYDWQYESTDLMRVWQW